MHSFYLKFELDTLLCRLFLGSLQVDFKSITKQYL